MIDGAGSRGGAGSKNRPPPPNIVPLPPTTSDASDSDFGDENEESDGDAELGKLTRPLEASTCVSAAHESPHTDAMPASPE
jgi:hypothetical protein